MNPQTNLYGPPPAISQNLQGWQTPQIPPSSSVNHGINGNSQASSDFINCNKKNKKFL